MWNVSSEGLTRALSWPTPTRTEKTICLVVSSALKVYGLGVRLRLFEMVQKVRDVNRQRGHSGKSYSKIELDVDKELAIDYLVT